MHTIKWIPREQLFSILPLLQMINEGVSHSELEVRLKALSEANYRCAGVYDDKQLVGICGVWTLYKHYIGKHIELDNVVILPGYRNQGIGEDMLQWLQEWATKEGYVGSEINCYVHNSEGLKFWLNQGYKLIGFHCQKKWE